MADKKRTARVVAAAAVLLVALFGLRRLLPLPPKPAPPPSHPVPAAPIPAPPAPAALKKQPPKKLASAPTPTPTPMPTPPPAPAPAPPPAPKAAPSALPTPAQSGTPAPPKIELHKELIPRDIAIVRCYYDQEIVGPGATAGFDLNGSGFTAEFEKMIKVESGDEHVKVKNLHLATANQIHGELEVDARAATAFVYPRVVINGLPVFRAPEPMAVVRTGEVLALFFISLEEHGRGGRVRVITNLDDALAKTFEIRASTPGIRFFDMQGHLPYIADARMEIGPRVPSGVHGLSVWIDGREAFRRDQAIRIVKPNMGRSGLIHGVAAEEGYRRPGDQVRLRVQGTGLSAEDAEALDVKVVDFEVAKASVVFGSPVELRAFLFAPSNIPPGSYGVRLLNAGQTILERKDVFRVVGPDWVAGVLVSPPLKAGSRSGLKILGRDLSPEFAASLKVEADEPGITLTGLSRVDAATITGEISVAPAVAPGDYWLHLSAGGRKIDPPYGSIIKVLEP